MGFYGRSMNTENGCNSSLIGTIPKKKKHITLECLHAYITVGSFISAGIMDNYQSKF